MLKHERYETWLEYLKKVVDPVTSANNKYLSLLRTSCKMIGDFKGEREFSAANHLLALREERRGGQKIWYDTNEAK